MSTSVTSRSVTVTWGTIDCIQRNGEITGYVVQYQEEGGASVSNTVDVNPRTFEASELQPFTHYIFRVAGVNEDVSPDTGPYVTISVTTREDSTYVCLFVCVLLF